LTRSLSDRKTEEAFAKLKKTPSALAAWSFNFTAIARTAFFRKTPHALASWSFNFCAENAE